jgi:dienelactone hydrolase
MRISSAMSALAACIVSHVAVAQSVHVPLLPKPSGSHAVGTRVMYLSDTTRRDADFPRARPVTLQLWYPAARANAARPAPYLYEGELGKVLLRDSYYGMDSTTLIAWRTVRTHSFVDAPVAKGRFPLVAYSVGLGVARANYTSIAEELASHGYIVAMVESPLQGMMVLPDGRTISDTAGLTGEPAGHLRLATGWARDISFALDAIAAGAMSKSVDWAKVGATGHSSGGIVAVQACESDARIKACVNMDGGVSSPDGKPMAAFVEHGVTKPTLFLRSQPIYDDSTLARRGMTRAEWVKRGEGGRIGFDSLVARSRGPLRVAFVAGTGHFSFSDAAFVMPTAITRFGGRIIEPTRGWTVITSAVRAYFDETLSGGKGALDAVAARYPELTLPKQ